MYLGIGAFASNHDDEASTTNDHQRSRQFMLMYPFILDNDIKNLARTLVSSRGARLQQDTHDSLSLPIFIAALGHFLFETHDNGVIFRGLTKIFCVVIESRSRVHSTITSTLRRARLYRVTETGCSMTRA